MKYLMIGLGLLISWQAAYAGETTSALQPLDFVFFTDVHAREEWGTPLALERAARAINACHPAFAIAGGDLITDGFQTGEEKIQPRWDVYMQMHHAITAPVYVVIGNHDLVGALPEDGSQPLPDPRAMFKKQFNLEQTYRSFTTHGYHFILLDSPQLTTSNQYGYEGRIDPVQMEWIKEDLRQLSAGTPIILVTHLPLLTVFHHVTDAAEKIPVRGMIMNSDEVLELFNGHQLLLVLQGHTHAREAIQWRGTWFLTGGAICAKWWRGPWYGTQEGFLNIKLNANNVEWDYIEYEWEARRPTNK